MKYKVKLVQQGVSSQTLAVSGKSGRLYGTATSSPSDGGVAFIMTMAEYGEAAHDIVGNTAPNQQWVPIFVPEPVGAGTRAVKCCIPAGCATPAEYVIGSDFYCPAHAPLNAVHMSTGEARGDTPAPAMAAPEIVRDVAPKINEPGGDAPVEQMRSTIGTESETAPENLTLPIALQKPSKPGSEFTAPSEVPQPAVAETPSETARKIQMGAAPAPDQKAPTGASPEVPSAVQVMIDKVIEGVTAALPEIIDQRIAARIPTKTAAKQTRKPDLAPSGFRVLQMEAKDLGINVFQMSADQLKEAIAAKKKAAGG